MKEYTVNHAISLLAIGLVTSCFFKYFCTLFWVCKNIEKTIITLTISFAIFTCNIFQKELHCTTDTPNVRMHQLKIIVVVPLYLKDNIFPYHSFQVMTKIKVTKKQYNKAPDGDKL